MLKYALLSDKTTMTFKIKLEKYFTKVNFLIFCKKMLLYLLFCFNEQVFKISKNSLVHLAVHHGGGHSKVDTTTCTTNSEIKIIFFSLNGLILEVISKPSPNLAHDIANITLWTSPMSYLIFDYKWRCNLKVFREESNYKEYQKLILNFFRILLVQKNENFKKID